MSIDSIRPWRQILRRKSREISVGNVKIGGENTISVQTMTNTNTADAKTTIAQVKNCAEAGAEIVMIFDSSAHFLQQKSFLKYLDMMNEQIFSKFAKRIGYYAREGIDYDSIISVNKLKQTSLAGLGIDSNESLSKYFKLSRDYFIQGNFDEKLMLLSNTSMKLELEKFIKSIENFSEKERAGWICGLGHGILKETPEENVQTFVRMIRESFK